MVKNKGNKFKIYNIFILVILFSLSGCGKTAAGAKAATEFGDKGNKPLFTDRELTYEYDEAGAAKIRLDGDKADISFPDGIDRNILTTETSKESGLIINIKGAGTFIFEGESENTQIVVNADDEAKVELVLNSVNITSKSSACIYIQNADKALVNLPEGSVSTLSDTGDTYMGNTAIESVIYSEDDIVFHGTGKLVLNAGYKHGIISDNDLKILGCDMLITANKTALCADDSARLFEAKLDLTAGVDGINVGKGFFYEKDSDIVVKCSDDAIHSVKELTVEGGNIEIPECREGFEGHDVLIADGRIKVHSVDDDINAFGKDGPKPCLTVKGGELELFSEGDCLDSNGSIYIEGGKITLLSAAEDDDGAVDAVDGFYLNGGELLMLEKSGVTGRINAKSAMKYIACDLNERFPEGTEIKIKDEKDNEFEKIIATVDFSSVFYSSPKINAGKFRIITGNKEKTIEVK